MCHRDTGVTSVVFMCQRHRKKYVKNYCKRLVIFVLAAHHAMFISVIGDNLVCKQEHLCVSSSFSVGIVVGNRSRIVR